ncbi:FecR domain-containing protein [Acetobacter sacchari]|uniref:FecR domain-containing protein n=1 Tax=Acetobacter sacchari TaxID=2661687 RepID=A0ABS3M100_9PROT|nr:FecR domain-containing protein [Acetobacter sacchari]MBO1361867.1 FecR domain-containing protein [Acetobacter sacchari]
MPDNIPSPDALDRTLAEMRRQLGAAKVGKAYERRINRRSFLMRTATAATLAGGGVYVARDNDIDLPGMGADVHTATAQISRIELAASSRITLAPRTAVDIRHEQGVSLVRLRHGTVLFEPGESRLSAAIRVETRMGAVETISAPFQASASSHSLAVSAADTPVAVHGQKGQLVPVPAGCTVAMSPSGMLRTTSLWDDVRAWTRGDLVVESGTLRDIVVGLRPYWDGHIVMSPRAADIPAAGVFSLLQVDRTLGQLGADFPIQISHLPFRTVLLTAIS